MIHALPVQASSAFYCQLKPENHTEESDVAVRQRFGEIAGSAFDTVITAVWLELVAEEAAGKTGTACIGIMGEDFGWTGQTQPRTDVNPLLLYLTDKVRFT